MTARPGPSGFLADTAWHDAALAPLAGDASGRHYLRLTGKDGNTAILMDAPPETCGPQEPFVRLSAHLRAIGLAAPEVLHADLTQGYLLLEDFGDRLFAKEAMAGREAENRLYELATDVLIHLRRPPPPGLRPASAAVLTDMADLAYRHYCPGAGYPCSDVAVQAAQSALHRALDRALSGPEVMILRDYHAENLIWRPDQDGLLRAGVLDFQDALRGHPAYDLVSLLQDARRDLAEGSEAALLRRYITLTGEDAETFDLAYHTIAVQRHLRILGIFARLSLTQGKSDYIAYVPRTWNHLQKALAHPALDDLAATLRDILPAPTAAVLNRLKGLAP